MQNLASICQLGAELRADSHTKLSFDIPLYFQWAKISLGKTTLLELFVAVTCQPPLNLYYTTSNELFR